MLASCFAWPVVWPHKTSYVHISLNDLISKSFDFVIILWLIWLTMTGSSSERKHTCTIATGLYIILESSHVGLPHHKLAVKHDKAHV